MPRTATFDLAALERGHAELDAEAITRMYAEDAVIEIIDATHPPSSPLVLVGRDAIRNFYDDVCSRDLVSTVDQAFTDGEHLAVRISCRYATGERVVASQMSELRDGRIAKDVLVQAWDA